MKNYLLLLLIIAGLGVGCYEDIDNTKEPEVIIEISEVFITSRISGSVYDKEGNTISDYSLLINDETNPVWKDQFYLEMDGLKKKGQTIHVVKDGQQIGISTELLVENDINYIEIQQHDAIVQTKLEENPSLLSISDNITADLTSVKWKDDYQGEVAARFASIDPSISLTCVGYDANSDLLALEAHGGFYLDFLDVNDEVITAQAQFPVLLKTSELNEDVNSLFVFEEKDEVWILVSEIKGGEEVEILGDGYYAFANYTPGVFVEGRVTKDDNPVAYQSMTWEYASLSNDFKATESGQWIALVPEGQEIDVQLINPCNEIVQNELISIGNEDLLHQYVEVEPSILYQKLDMKVLNCAGDEVLNPNINFTSSGKAYNYHFSETYRNSWLPVCGDFEISALDSETGEAGSTLEWSAEIASGLDVLTNCSEHQEGFSYIKIRDDEKVFTAFNILREGDRFTLISGDETFKLIVKGTEEGVYDTENINIYINEPELGGVGYYIKCENSSFGCGIEEFNLTHFDSEEGGTVRASFSGTLWMQTINPSVAGNFKVEGVILIKL